MKDIILKLQNQGLQSLNNIELLTLITRNMETASIIMQRAGSLAGLARLNMEEISNIEGVSNLQASAIIAALELKKRAEKENNTGAKITGSNVAFDCLKPFAQFLNHEEFFVMFLNRANKVIKIEQTSKGGIAGTVVDVRIIFKRAIELNASSMILAHNHPSGNLEPSQNDIEITKKMVQAGTLMDVPVLDHLILTDSEYKSFADEGLI